MLDNLPVINLAIWILLLPLGSFAVQIFFGKRLPRQGDWLSTGALLAALVMSVLLFAKMIAGDGIDAGQRWMWLDLREISGLSFADLSIEAGIRVDNITAIMLVVVTLVSFLVHLYSIGYMHGDSRYSRYYAYLGLFSFSMLGLVLCDSFLFLFVFWELVGVGSFLLIGFWYEKNSAANACKKAFLVNRVGDLGFLLGILLVFFSVGELGFREVFAALPHAEGISYGLWTAAGLCLFCGAVGKSAQFPLHVWLPDAMEGPTPVSALIHAATMVAAGVYMVARIFPILTPTALTVIACVGIFTAFMAATIALTQNDIKKVLAYSTISQLGYMVAALGVFGYVAGLLHLVTHAAFKACLFLGSGSVIHAVHTQDMREMGGLRTKQPITFATFLVATCAISGIPLFSGFYSKDKILVDTLAFGMGHDAWTMLIPVAALLTAGLTAFYMFRLVFMTFLGYPRDKEKFSHAHESPWTMTVPLIVLATLSLSFWFYIGGWFENLVTKPETALPAQWAAAEQMGGHGTETHGGGGHAAAAGHHDLHDKAHHIILWLAPLIVFPSIALAFLFYVWNTNLPKRTAQIFAPVYTFFLNKWYIDELYGKTVVAGSLLLSKGLAWFDLKWIDGAVNAVARWCRRWAFGAGKFDNAAVDGAVNLTGSGTIFTGQLMRLFQTGQIQTYVLYLVVGILVILGLKTF